MGDSPNRISQFIDRIMNEHKEPENNQEGIAFIGGFGGGEIGSDRSLAGVNNLKLLTANSYFT
jgi:hypothetical protein